MFDEDKYKDSDDLMRSILSQEQEEVPAHVWEGISSKLDRIEAAESRKTVVLWFRRAAATVAAAAAVAVGVFVDWNGNGNIVNISTDKGLIAVADTPEINIVFPGDKPDSLTERPVRYLADASEEVAEAIAAAAGLIVEEEPAIPAEEKKTQKQETVKPEESWQEIWEEDEISDRSMKRRGTSLVLSGIAGTNSAQSRLWRHSIR